MMFPMALPMVVLVLLLLAFVVLVLLVQVRGASEKRKRKRDYEPEADDYLSEMAEEGMVRLEDDGELPELAEDDLFYDEKPKRSEEG